MSKQDILVAKAKGRPMLTWVGKKPLARVTAFVVTLSPDKEAL